MHVLSIIAVLTSGVFSMAATAELSSSRTWDFNQLPYAKRDLIFQSTDAVERACTAFEASAKADIDRFVQLSQEGDYETAYQTWSDLLFRYFSFLLELGQTSNLSSDEELKAFIKTKGDRFHVGGIGSALQKLISENPALLAAFINNGKAAAKLTPQQCLFTENILKEYLESHAKEAPSIQEVLGKLSQYKKEAYTTAQGIVSALAPETLAEFKVFTANVICFPGDLAYTYGGMPPWKSRIDRLAETILQRGAHIVCLQEVWDPEAMRALKQKLENDYAFFVYDAGDPAGTIQVSKGGYSSGLFIASKLPLDAIDFKRFASSIPQGSNRGILTVTCRIGKERIVLANTHLQHGSGVKQDPESLKMRAARKDQFDISYALLQEIVRRTLPNSSWGILAGDLNVNKFTPEFEEIGLPRLFSVPTAEDKGTYSDYFEDLVMAEPSKRAEVKAVYWWLDYCVTPVDNTNARTISSQTVVPLFWMEDPTANLSDHHGLETVYVRS